MEVLPYSGSLKWLGRKVTFDDPSECELNNRIASAWGAFSKHKAELTNKRYRLQDRLRLFAAVITPSVLYGCETWTLRQDQQQRLRTVQRKMLRMILCAKRRTISSEDASTKSDSTDGDSIEQEALLEPWPAFLERTARWTEEQMGKAGQEEWLTQWRRRQWAWASKLQNKNAHKWSAAATLWNPLLHSRAPCGRPQARPRKRWHEDMQAFLRHKFGESCESWHAIAMRSESWMGLSSEYVEHFCRKTNA
jgi:hypothetical protein